MLSLKKVEFSALVVLIPILLRSLTTTKILFHKVWYSVMSVITIAMVKLNFREIDMGNSKIYLVLKRIVSTVFLLKTGYFVPL